MKYKNNDYSMLDKSYLNAETFIKRIASGDFRSLIINGPPGIGKSVMTSKYLKKYNTKNYSVITGHMTLLSLYDALYRHRAKGQVLVLDDVDSVFAKTEGLCLLKAAMDTQEVNRVYWARQTNLLNAMGLPQQFVFKGAVILITNIGFGGSRVKMQSHLTALKDRSYVVPITDSGCESENFKQICFMVKKQNLLKKYKMQDKDIDILLTYLENNLDDLYTISLRTMIKLAELYQVEPKQWKELAFTALTKYGKE